MKRSRVGQGMVRNELVRGEIVLSCRCESDCLIFATVGEHLKLETSCGGIVFMHEIGKKGRIPAGFSQYGWYALKRSDPDKKPLYGFASCEPLAIAEHWQDMLPNPIGIVVPVFKTVV